MELIVECTESLPTIGDLTKLKQVIINIVSNSLKFTEAGFVKLTAMRRADGLLVLAVEDTGPGVPPEHRERMFTK